MVLLAKKWNGDTDPTGFWASEKLDGHRAWWTGKEFISRGGNTIKAPSWFTEGLPEIALDGEIWAGRGKFERVGSIHSKRPHEWKFVKYAVFDAPEAGGPFEKRLLVAINAVKNAPNAFAIPFWKVKSAEHLREELDKVVQAGGEGLMIREPGSLYVKERSSTLLKVVPKYDAEAFVIGHVEGTRPGLCGSLDVVTPDGRRFKVAGLSEFYARKPPPIGTKITYSYRLLSAEGIPRPASFVRIRKDL